MAHTSNGMKKILIAIGIVIVAGAGWWIIDTKGGETGEEITQVITTATTSAWIQVDNDKVFRVDDSDKELGIYASGDRVEAGTIIKTDSTGSGSIYFSDGSTLRIDPNSKVRIDEAEFGEDNNTLKVRVSLLTGRVWSKIVALATPESHWEVRTATAVATVRGSAFGTEVTANGETLIVGSEHDIAVAPIDEKTGEIKEGEEVIVSEGEELTINRERKLAKRQRHEDDNLRKWIEKNEARDGIIRDKINELKEEGLSGAELRMELRDVIKTELQERFDDKVEEISERTGLPEAEVEQKLETRIETKIETRTRNIETEVSPVRPTVTSLEVRTNASSLKITEGTIINFEAIVVYSDGTKKVVTEMVSWQVVGPIGKMQNLQKAGVFIAALGAEVSEIGTAFGAVTASYKSENGKEFFGKSDIITVIGAIVPVEDQRG